MVGPVRIAVDAVVIVVNGEMDVKFVLDVIVVFVF